MVIFFVKVERDAKIGKLQPDVAKQQKAEILAALRKLGESLQPEEEEFLEGNLNASLRQFEKVSENIGKFNQSNLFITLNKAEILYAHGLLLKITSYVLYTRNIQLLYL